MPTLTTQWRQIHNMVNLHNTSLCSGGEISVHYFGAVDVMLSSRWIVNNEILSLQPQMLSLTPEFYHTLATTIHSQLLLYAPIEWRVLILSKMSMITLFLLQKFHNFRIPNFKKRYMHSKKNEICKLIYKNNFETCGHQFLIFFE